MNGRLRRARAARRKLPDCDLVPARRFGVEVFGGSCHEVPEPCLVRPQLLPIRDYQQPAKVTRGGYRLADRAESHTVNHSDLRSRVVEVVSIVLRSQERVNLGDDSPNLQYGVPGRYELDAVAQREQHAVLGADAELAQHVPHPIGKTGHLGIGVRAIVTAN